MSIFAHTCKCGHRIEAGRRCPVCERPRPKPTEAQRLAHNPKRRSYATAKYRHNRMVRYHLVGGICERPDCGTKLKGDLWPDGKPWECHHITNPIGDRDDTPNLRCYCKRHHNRWTR